MLQPVQMLQILSYEWSHESWHRIMGSRYCRVHCEYHAEECLAQLTVASTVRLPSNC